jgi:prepilin-type N-terminal cleavage/methylation domain-containing protein
MLSTQATQPNMKQPRTYLKCKTCKNEKCRKKWCVYCFGFTLLEMLVVIAIIGVLAGVVLGYFTVARDKARLSTVVNQVNQLDKALRVHMYASNNSSWPLTPAQGSNYDFDTILSPSPPSGFENFSNYIPSVPVPPITGTYYGYINTGTPYTCGASLRRTGVNIRIGESGDPLLDQLALDLDEKFDGGDGPNCGKIRYGISEIIINVASDSTDF